VVDVPELCSFIVPAILRRGEVTVAVSTAGASPTLAQRIRDRIAAVIGEEYGRMAALLRDLRPAVHERWRDPEQRREVWARLVDSPLLELLRDDRETQTKDRASEILDNLAFENAKARRSE
jgi:siroheme synthase-like protein